MYASLANTLEVDAGEVVARRGKRRDVMMNREHIDPDSEQIREVYARFGVAIYYAQCLERQLAIILATKYGPGPTRISQSDFDRIIDDLFSKTLGQLVSEIRRAAELSDDEGERLKKALEKRNWLAHRYFWDRAADLVTISKWPDATVGGTTGAHMRAVTLRGSWPPSCRIGPGPHGTWRAMPASVPQPTGAPDTAADLELQRHVDGPL